MRDLRDRPRVTLVFTDLTQLDSLQMAVNSEVEMIHDLLKTGDDTERQWAAKHLDNFRALEQRITDASKRLERKLHY